MAWLPWTLLLGSGAALMVFVALAQMGYDLHGLGKPLRDVPASVWAASLTALFGLTGVMLTVRDASARLRRQILADRDAQIDAHQFESIKSQKEQHAKLRHEVTLLYAGALNTFASELVRLPEQISRGESQPKFLQEFLSLSARVQLVSEPETAALALRLEDALRVALRDASMASLTVARAKKDIEIAEQYYSKYSADVERVLQLQKSALEAGEHEEAKYAPLRRSFESTAAFMDDWANRRTEANSKHLSELMAYAKSVIEAENAVAPLRNQLLEMIRGDLALDDRNGAYRSELKVSQHRREADVSIGFKSLSKAVAEVLKESQPT
ncbi:MAG: hypothetical protein CVU21_14260 [Betaproteobacteria bacterium HGW-Betaproteobacteria-15]|nr:MAG: hypothetical protein CVU21_14260 [Betaproteobacteria bacterium HGW-Betaproteobacteria-15]